MALTADVADAKAECTRATESYTKRKDLEAKVWGGGGGGRRGNFASQLQHMAYAAGDRFIG